MYRQLDYVVVRQVKQKRVGCGGTGCTDAVLSTQNGELRNANCFIACVSLLETLFRSTKRKKPLGYLLYVQYNSCCMQGACTTFSPFYSFKQQFHSFIVLAGLSAGSHSEATLNCSQKKTESI